MEQQVNAAETANTDTENPNTDVLRVTSDFIGRGAMAYGTVTDLKILNMVLESGKHAKNPDSPDCVATSSIRYMIPGGEDWSVSYLIGRGNTEIEAMNDYLSNLRTVLRLNDHPLSVEEALQRKGSLREERHSKSIDRSDFASDKEYLDAYVGKKTEISSVLFTDLVPSGTPVLRAIDIAAKESNVKVIDRKIEKSETDGIDFIHVLTTNNIAFANVFGRALLEAKAEVSEFETPEVKYSDVSVFIPVIMESFLNEVGERARFDRDGIDDVMDEYISLAIDAIYEKLPMTSKRIVGPGCHEALMSILRLYDPTYTNGYSISPKCEKECFVEHIRNHLNMFENNLNDDEYSVLEEKANEPSIPWIIVGTQDNIRGRQLSDTKYEFEAIRADGVVKLEIDLEGYSMQALEIICREKGQELIDLRRTNEDSWFQVATWAFETEIADNDRK